jgi:hypothetical protein
MSGLRKFARENGLSLFFLSIFLAALGGQAIAGREAFNQDQVEHGERATRSGNTSPLLTSETP